MADTKRDLLKAIKYFLDEAIVLPPGQLEDPNLLRSIQSFQKEVTKKKMAMEILAEKANEKEKLNPLHRTGKPFGATWNDIKRRYTLYCSDLKERAELVEFVKYKACCYVEPDHSSFCFKRVQIKPQARNVQS